MPGVYGGRHVRRIEPSAILQLVLRIEVEEVRRALSVIGSRNLLRLVNHVGEAKAVLARECLHILERVLAVGLCVVWHDGDSPDTDLAQRVGLCHDGADARLHVWTVIADEDNERAFGPANVGERIGAREGQRFADDDWDRTRPDASTFGNGLANQRGTSGSVHRWTSWRVEPQSGLEGAILDRKNLT